MLFEKIKYMEHKEMLVEMDFPLHAIFYSIMLTWEGETCSCPDIQTTAGFHYMPYLLHKTLCNTGIFHNIATYMLKVTSLFAEQISLDKFLSQRSMRS
jgi:hypothetical protein